MRKKKEAKKKKKKKCGKSLLWRGRKISETPNNKNLVKKKRLRIKYKNIADGEDCSPLSISAPLLPKNILYVPTC